MNERIKELRKALGFTQHEFADRLGISRGNIGSYEVGKSNPGGSVITLICKTFNVSEEWLRTGKGEMFAKLSEEDELSAMVGRLMAGESADFKRRLVNALSTLKDEQWLLLEAKLKEIVDVRSTASQAVDTEIETTSLGQTGADIMSELAELKRQNEEIKRQNEEIRRQNQALAAKVAAMEEEDKTRGLWDGSSASPSATAGSFDPARSAKR